MDPYATHLQALVYASLMNEGDILELGCAITQHQFYRTVRISLV
jgi:hypothetical protein